MPIAEGLNLLFGFVETVATVVQRCVPVAKDLEEEGRRLREELSCCKFKFAGFSDVPIEGGNGDGDKAREG